MSGPKWVSHIGPGLTMGFSSLADAEVFLRRQSNNPLWLEQWTFKLEFLHGEQVATASTKQPVSVLF
jgi:hypothetical protein